MGHAKVATKERRSRPRSGRLTVNGAKAVSFEERDPYSEDGHRFVDSRSLKKTSERLLKIRQSLPVYKNRDEIMHYIEANPVTVLIGETGSGKSTQIPQFLLQTILSRKERGSVAVTQPRRVAAINLATRVSQEYGCNLGDTVGYSVRFDNASNSHTRLKYLTDGMLLREIMSQKTLKEYSTIIIDEAHERTVLTDLILGFLKSLIDGPRKSNLKIIIMSATLQAEKFSAFFRKAPILFVEGRKYKVEQYYLKAPCEDIVDYAVRCCVQINQGEVEGDVLCFLPGQEEIDKAVAILNKISPIIAQENKVPAMVAFPLYASLSPAQQAEVFAHIKGFKRKVVFSTNIAETSVTISGVKYVIDSGLRKVKVWRHQLGLSTLLTVPISQASAQQRMGRAGRESEGKCFRLYTEQDYARLPSVTEPEIARSDITSPVLMLKKYNVQDIINWTWFENPGKGALLLALQELYELKALDDFGKITSVGESMALLPLQPHLSAVLIHGNSHDCLQPVLDIIACLSVENLLLNPPPEERDAVNEQRLSLCRGGKMHGDLIMMKELYDIYTAELKTSSERNEWCKQLYISSRGFKNVIKVREQLQQYCKRLFPSSLSQQETTVNYHGTVDEIRGILKSFLSGFAKNTAIGMPDRSYRTVTAGETISIHPSSLLFMNKSCPAIMYTEYVFTTKGYARNVSRIELSWLQELAGGALSRQKIGN